MLRERFIKKGFTLPELLIAVSISAILITSLLIFVSSGIHAAYRNDKIMGDKNENLPFEKELSSTLSHVNKTSPIIYSGSSFWSNYKTGYFLKMDYPETPLTFLWIESFTGYCNGSDTNELYRFVLKKITLPDATLTTATDGANTYKIDPIGNTILKSNNRIVGTGYRGSNLGSKGIETELNSPSGIVYAMDRLYIADTLNNRILSYNPLDSTIKAILTEQDGINRPSSLWYYNNALIIANTWNGEILKYHDSLEAGSTLSINFKLPEDVDNVSSLHIRLEGIPNITSPSASSNIMLVWVGTSPEETVGTGSELTYRFSSSVMFVKNNTYGLRIQWISPLSTTVGTHLAELVFSGSTGQKSYWMPYYMGWDGIFETKNGNYLKTLSGGLLLPRNITGENVWVSGVSDWSDLIKSSTGEIIRSENPVENLQLLTGNQFLTTKMNSYQFYDCLEEKHVLSERVIKSSLK